MAGRWMCARCSAPNEQAAVSCRTCGAIRGAVITAAAADAPPVEGLAAESARASEAATFAQAASDASGEPPGPAPRRRRLIGRATFGLGVLLAMITAVGIYAGPGRSADGQITRGGHLSTEALRAGDCYDLLDPAADEVAEVSARRCDEEHEYEVFYVTELEVGDYPGNEGFGAIVDDRCVAEFGSYVGRPYADSELDIFWLQPTSDAWAAGNRSIQCAAFHPRIHRLTQSVKGWMQ